MPNWCENIATFKHNELEMMAKLNEAIVSKKLFGSFFPTPPELDQDGLHSEENEQFRELLCKKYGYETGYDWRIGEWGTKWDTEPYVMDEFDNSITLSFDTAWDPPLAFYDKMVGLGFDVNAMYHEPGMAFAGIWENGFEDHYEYGGIDSTQIAEELPEELDEAFRISESVSGWEEDNDEE